MDADAWTTMPPMPPGFPHEVVTMNAGTPQAYDTWVVKASDAAKLMGVDRTMAYDWIEAGKVQTCTDPEDESQRLYVYAESLWALVPKHLRQER